MEHFPSSFPRRSIVLLLAWLSLIILAEAQTVSNNTDQSWTVTTVAKGPGAPLRTTEKCSKSGSKILCEKNVEVLGPDGYRPSFYIETETDQEDATTTRSIQHSYRPDGSGRKQLVQVTEEETKHLPNGESDVVRTTSKPNPGGRSPDRRARTTSRQERVVRSRRRPKARLTGSIATAILAAIWLRSGRQMNSRSEATTIVQKRRRPQSRWTPATAV